MEASPEKGKLKKENVKDITVDEIYWDLGELGPWQWICLFTLWVPSVVGGFVILTFSFVGMSPKEFVCQTSHHTDNPSCTVHQWFMDNSVGPDGIVNRITPSDCKGFPYMSLPNRTCTADSQEMRQCNPGDPGTAIHYRDFTMDFTVITEFGLVCDQYYKVALAGSIFMAGLFFGSGLAGRVSDSFGRKKCIVVFLLICGLAHLAGGFMPNYWAYVASRFFAAIGTSVMLPGFCLGLEVVGSKYRTFACMFNSIPFAIGEALVPVVAYFIRDWRTFHMVSSVPIFLSLLIYFILPESPSWLLVQGKADQLQQVVNSMTKWNGKKLSCSNAERFETLLNRIETDVAVDKNASPTPEESQDCSGQDVTTAEIFTHPGMRKSLIIMFINWIIVTMSFYALSMITVTMGDNVFVSGVLTALIEIPSYLFCLAFMDRIGRKPICVLTFLLTGLTCIPAAFAPGNLQIALALIGKFSDTAAFAVVYMYAAELFPTKVRNTAVGMCSMSARVGGVLASQVVHYLPTVTSDETPMILIGSCAIIAGMLTLLLPETLGSLTVQTVKDVENLGSVAKPFFKIWSGKKLSRHLQAQTESNELALKVIRS